MVGNQIKFVNVCILYVDNNFVCIDFKINVCNMPISNDKLYVHVVILVKGKIDKHVVLYINYICLVGTREGV